MMRAGPASSTRVRGNTRRSRVSMRALVMRASLFAVAAGLSGCGAPPRAPGTAVIASGSDLESGNPAVTIHPLSRQLQRHALFVTLVRLDSALQPSPYYA